MEDLIKILDDNDVHDLAYITDDHENVDKIDRFYGIIILLYLMKTSSRNVSTLTRFHSISRDGIELHRIVRYLILLSGIFLHVPIVSLIK